MAAVDKKEGIMVFIILAVIIALYFVATQRSLVKAKENIANAFSQIKVSQQSRFDALTELAKATKSYSEYEYNTLMEVISKRKSSVDVKDLADNEEILRNLSGRINALAENYPDLKASETYKETMQSINKYENTVRTARMVFNDTVTIYNRKVKQFPSSIVASILGYDVEGYLEMDDSKADMPNLVF